MTYRFATEEEIEKAIRGLDIPAKDRLLRKVFAERDAYREGWKKLVFLAFKITDMSLEKTVLSDIDAEARRLLCGDTARIMEGK